MKKSLILAAVAAVFGTSVAAQAAVTLSVTRSAAPVNGLDEIVVKVTALTGADAVAGANGASISSLTGTFARNGGFIRFSTDDSETTRLGAPVAGPDFSFVNFDGTAGAFTRSPNGTTDVNSLNGAWFTSTPGRGIKATDNPAFSGDQTLLARVYVAPGAGFSFGGFYSNFNGQVIGAPISFEIVPEPGTLGLLAVGSLATLARRRK